MTRPSERRAARDKGRGAAMGAARDKGRGATLATARGTCRGALILAGLVAAAPLPALAHAALLEAEVATAVRLLARYDTGAPMQGAQVIIYAPDTPAEAWDRGTTDAEGRFVFVPDPALPGRWSIQVRQAGHGALTHVQIGAGAPGAGPETAPVPAAVIERPATTAGPMQRAVMVALVAWGALGTALYFRRRGHGDASA